MRRCSERGAHTPGQGSLLNRRRRRENEFTWFAWAVALGVLLALFVLNTMVPEESVPLGDSPQSMEVHGEDFARETERLRQLLHEYPATLP